MPADAVMKLHSSAVLNGLMVAEQSQAQNPPGAGF